MATNRERRRDSRMGTGSGEEILGRSGYRESIGRRVTLANKRPRRTGRNASSSFCSRVCVCVCAKSRAVACGHDRERSVFVPSALCRGPPIDIARSRQACLNALKPSPRSTAERRAVPSAEGGAGEGIWVLARRIPRSALLVHSEFTCHEEPRAICRAQVRPPTSTQEPEKITRKAALSSSPPPPSASPPSADQLAPSPRSDVKER